MVHRSPEALFIWVAQVRNQLDTYLNDRVHAYGLSLISLINTNGWVQALSAATWPCRQ